MALLGPNGCGKTTLLHLIVGLLRPNAGQIEAFGRRRVAEADFHEVRRRVGLLFQDADDQLFCPTVAEDVAFGPLNLGKSRDEVRRIVAATLDSLGLAGYEHRVTYQLSGGEKRLVALGHRLGDAARRVASRRAQRRTGRRRHGAADRRARPACRRRCSSSRTTGRFGKR